MIKWWFNLETNRFLLYINKNIALCITYYFFIVQKPTFVTSICIIFIFILRFMSNKRQLENDEAILSAQNNSCSLHLILTRVFSVLALYLIAGLCVWNYTLINHYRSSWQPRAAYCTHLKAGNEPVHLFRSNAGCILPVSPEWGSNSGNPDSRGLITPLVR